MDLKNLMENNLATSPTQLSLKKLKEDGYLVAITEHWNPFARIRQDLFGFIDLLAIKDGQVLAIQTTSKSNMNARVKKIGDSEHIGKIRKCNWQIEVWGWSKNKSNRWELKVIDVS